jgi:hypothetical protein
MDDKEPSNRIMVYRDGPPVIYIVDRPVSFFSIGVFKSEYIRKNNLAKTTS